MYENKTGIEESLEKNKGYSMALKLDPPRKDKVVGPGAYQPEVVSSKKNAPKIRFGSEQRGKTKIEGVPDPN